MYHTNTYPRDDTHKIQYIYTYVSYEDESSLGYVFDESSLGYVFDESSLGYVLSLGYVDESSLGYVCLYMYTCTYTNMYIIRIRIREMIHLSNTYSYSTY